jgi:hypothetical protein
VERAARVSRLDELARVAPRIDRTLLRVIADLIDGAPHPDVLLIVGDALGDAACELSVSGHSREAIELSALRRLLIDDVARLGRSAFW